MPLPLLWFDTSRAGLRPFWWGGEGVRALTLLRHLPLLYPGALSTVRALDREEVAQHNLTVVAADHGSPRRSATQLLLVHVLDVNDETPAFPRSHYEVSLAENLPPGASVLQLQATDRDLGKKGGSVRAVVPSIAPTWR